MSYGLATGIGKAPPSGGVWNTMPIGAGGQALSLQFANDGTFIHYCDSTGAWKWNPNPGRWDQLITTASFPSSELDQTASSPKNQGGCYAAAIAPNDSSRIYVVHNPYFQGNALGGAAKIFISSDGGATFVACTTQPTGSMTLDGNDHTVTFMNHRLTVDPANKDHVLFFVKGSGVYRTTDAGANWALATGVPTSVVSMGILFDPSSAVTSGKTQGIYLYSSGNGTYHSTNGGTSFSIVSGTPTFTIPSAGEISARAAISSDGVYYITTSDGSNTKANNHIWRLQSGTWTDVFQVASIPTGTVVCSICTSPFSAGTLVLQHFAGVVIFSRDYGATWSSVPTGDMNGLSNVRTARDVHWLEYTNEFFMTVGDIVMDPFTPDKIWFAEGCGIWYLPDLTNASINPNVNWVSQNTGQEQIIGFKLIMPPGGYPLAVVQDRGIYAIKQPGVCPSKHGPDATRNLNLGMSVEWASSDPRFVVFLNNSGSNTTPNGSAFSTDYGDTWTSFTTVPAQYAAGHTGGVIAVASPTNMIWMCGQEGDMYRTTDGGSNWTRIPASAFGHGIQELQAITCTAATTGTGGVIRFTVSPNAGTLTTGGKVGAATLGTGVFDPNNALIPGTCAVTVVNSTTVELADGPTSWSGTFSSGTLNVQPFWSHNQIFRKWNLVADRVDIGTFYAYNPTSVAAGGGIYKTTDTGATWSQVTSTMPETFTGSHSCFFPAPAHAGHLVYTSGDSESTGLWYSTNSGLNWGKLSGTAANECFCWGAPKPGNDYPSLYFVGFRSTTWGIWRADGNASDWAATSNTGTGLTWTNLAATPPGNTANRIICIAADYRKWSEVYIMTDATAGFYYKP